MNRKKMLGVSALLIFIASMIPSCQATIEKDFGEFHKVWGNNTLFTFNVKMCIQTEKDGTWRFNKTYRIYVIVCLTYVNWSIYDWKHPFSLYINNTEFTLFVDVKYRQEGFGLYDLSNKIEMLYDVSNSFYPPYSMDLEPHFEYSYPYPYTGERVTLEWLPKEPVYVDISADSQSEVISKMDSIENQLNMIRNLMYILVATTIILIATTGYLAVKKYKTGRTD